jgi:hypothetical protein
LAFSADAKFDYDGKTYAAVHGTARRRRSIRGGNQ